MAGDNGSAHHRHTMKLRPLLLKLDVGSSLALAFFLLSVFLTLVLTLAIDFTVSRQIKSDIGTNLEELAVQTTTHLDRSMFERYREVQLLAQRNLLDGSAGGRQRGRDALNALQKTYPYYAWMGMTDTAGRVLVATGGLLEGQDVSARPWFRNALRNVYVGDVHKAVLLARLLPNPGGDLQRFVDVAFPYHDAAGNVAGVLGTHIAWSWATDITQSILAPVSRDRRVQVVIATADGTVLLGPPGLQGLAVPAQQDDDAGISTWPDGKTYLVGSSASRGHGGYPGLGWRVFVLHDLDDAYAPVRRVRDQVVLGGLSMALLFSALALLAARMITRPLTRLAHSAQRIEAGEAVAIDDPGSNAFREIRDLAGAFGSLLGTLQHNSEALQQLNATLEKRVDDRTTELRKALAKVQENEKRVRAIVESAQGAFVAMDFLGRIGGWNTQAEKLLGWKRAEVMGQPLFQVLIPARFRAVSETAFQRFQQTQQAGFINQRMERLVLTADGTELPVEMNIALVKTGQAAFFCAFLYDISERKAVERMKDEFISTVSHELRTPLTGIYGSLSLLVSGMAGELPEDVRQLLALSHQSAERLIRLINDVLDVEKMASNSMQYHFVVQPLRPLVEQAIAATQPFADPYRVRLLLQADAVPAMVRVDADRMVQVVVNLLSNAAKFSPPGGATVEIGIAARGGQVRLSVIDHGSGIPESFHGRIFERFAQVDGSDRRQKGGTGLGLSICRSIVLAHGGQIGFAATPGGGTTFHVDLPAAEAP